VPKDMFAFAQMTAEVITDEEYLDAMYQKMRIRTALIGVESFSEEGLKSAGKLWNPVGQKMVAAIQKIQATGIMVLSSIICGLESDTLETIRTMRKFANESGTLFAQFTVYNPYPGTKDFHEMMDDRKNLGKADFLPKHKTQIMADEYWLKPLKPVDIARHPNMSGIDLHRENKQCWNSFYSLRQSLKRTGRGRARRWPWGAKIAYLLTCVLFKRAYAGYGMAADSVRRKENGTVTKMLLRTAVTVFNRYYREKRMRLHMTVMPTKSPEPLKKTPSSAVEAAPVRNN